MFLCSLDSRTSFTGSFDWLFPTATWTYPITTFGTCVAAMPRASTIMGICIPAIALWIITGRLWFLRKSSQWTHANVLYG